MSDYEITGIRQSGGHSGTHHIEAVKVGESLFFVDQIVIWIRDDAHRFWIWFQNERVDVTALQHASSRRFYLTVEGGGFPPTALLSLPRV
jgi:hypothetical protein